jgi:general stress protein CsbA
MRLAVALVLGVFVMAAIAYAGSTGTFWIVPVIGVGLALIGVLSVSRFLRR